MTKKNYCTNYYKGKLYNEHFEEHKILSTLDDCEVRNDQIIKIIIINNWLFLFSPVGKGINNNQ